MKIVKSLKPTEDIYHDIFFYKISLGNFDLILTKETLHKHFPIAVKLNKELKQLHNEFLSYRAGIIGIGLKNSETLFYKIYIGLEKNAIYIGCKCGMPDHVLCEHAYQGLLNFVDRTNGDFKPYFWPGYEPDINGVSKFLDIEITWLDIKIKPRSEFGNLFIKNQGFDGEKQIIIDPSRSKLSFRKQSTQPIIGYHFLYNAHPSTRYHLPFLLPFIATSNKNDSDILSYDAYIMEGNNLKVDLRFTSDQIKLNNICYQMYNLAFSTSGIKEDYTCIEKLHESAVAMLQLWGEAIPILKNEPYFKGSYSFDMKRLGDKPKKKDAYDLKIDKGTLKINLLLKEHIDHYTLEPMVSAYGKDITENFWKFPLFIVDPIRPSCYHFHLIDNLQDDSIIQWFRDGGSKLTILKEDFEEFSERLLNTLDDYYVLYFSAFKNRKKIRWNKQIPITGGFLQKLIGD